MELTLMPEMWVSWPLGHVYGSADSVTYQLWGGTGRRGGSPIPNTHTTFVSSVRKAAHRIMRSGELSQLLISCSTQETRPCALPGQHNTAGPG